MQVTFTADSMWQTMRWKGQRANDNNYMVAYHQQFGKEVNQTTVNLVTTGMDAATFANYTNEVKNRKWNFLNAYRTKNSLSRLFTPYAEGDILYNWANDLLRAANQSYYYQSFSYLLDTLSIDQPALLNSQTYQAFLQTYLHHHAAHSTMAMTPLHLKLQLIQGALSDTSLRYLVWAKLLMQEAQTASVEKLSALQGYATDFANRNPYTAYTPPVVRAIELAQRFAPGSPAPKFALTDLSGKTVTLSDFRGKVVYLAFGPVGAMPVCNKWSASKTSTNRCLIRKKWCFCLFRWMKTSKRGATPLPEKT